MNWWQAAILGLVEGITEYLPISSTGHLILTSSLLGLNDDPDTKSAVDSFNIVVQGGAILAVLGLYRVRAMQMVRGVLGFAGRYVGFGAGAGDPVGLRVFRNLVIAFLPAMVLGPLLDDLLEAYLFHAVPVLLALAGGAVYMMILDRRMIDPMRRAAREAESSGLAVDHESALETMTWRAALAIGMLQTVAMIPGTSRSMMTITAGVLVGLRPRQAAEFSFLLGLPTLGGACVFKLAKGLVSEDPSVFDLPALPIAVGLLVATVSAAAAVKWLVGFLTTHGLSVFGWYRIGLAVVLGSLILTGTVQLSAPDSDESVETETAAPEPQPQATP